MAQKKNNPGKPVEEESRLNKIAGDAAYMAGKIVVAKNDLVEMAGGAIETVKTAVKKITAKKNVEPGKTIKAAVSKVEKKVAPVKKAVKNIVKKTASAKKTVKAAAKKAVKKASPAKKTVKATVRQVTKKAAPAKKAIKKITKKVARKR